MNKNQHILHLNIYCCFLFLFNIQSFSFSQGYVHTNGNIVIDTNGSPIMLRGVNLGGWLVMENWMCGITDTNDVGYGRDQLTTLESRFNSVQVDDLIKTWQENWITENDFQFLNEKGFNFVRVPFGYRNLQDSDLNWYLDSSGNIDFKRFDSIVSMASRNNLYVLFDYHVWLNQKVQYSSISDQDTVINHTIQVWKVFANHFKDNSNVLGYDLLNEPTGSWNNNVVDAIYDTIRSIDQNHMISMEWVEPDTARWQNVLYQDHFYNLSYPWLNENIAEFYTTSIPTIELYEAANVPFYVGETHCFQSDSTWIWSLNEYCNRNIHWSPWTYKTVNMWGWGLINVDHNAVKVNLNLDDYLTIKTKWTELSNQTNWYLMNNLINIWSNAADCNLLSLDEEDSDIHQLFQFENQTNALKVKGGCNYKIVNALGLEVYRNSDNEIWIDLNFLKSGIYFILFENKESGMFVKYN